MDPLFYNGELIRAEEWDVGPNRLYSENYVYQHLHTFAHKPLHVATHIEILKEATRTVFGEAITLGAQELHAAVETLLKAGRYPLESNQVTVYVYPQGLRDEGEAVWMLEATAQLFYPRYQLRNTRPLLETFPFPHAWSGFPTAASRAASACARDAVRRSGAEIAVLERPDGTLTHIDDEPLFLVFGKEVATTPLTSGATDSVLRRLILAACELEEISCMEIPIKKEMLLQCDEAFTASTQGIISLMGYKTHRYFNLVARKVAARLNDIDLRI